MTDTKKPSLLLKIVMFQDHKRALFLVIEILCCHLLFWQAVLIVLALGNIEEGIYSKACLRFTSQ